MDENTFTIKEASKILHCSTQNIYQQKSKLMKLGFMEKSTIGSYCLNKEGINYLQEKRTETIKANNKVFNQVDNKSYFENSEVSTDTINIINLLNKQLHELKSEKEYWKNEYIKKDIHLQSKNEYIQNLNIQIMDLLKSTHLNKQQEQDVKKGFWEKFFNKK